MQAMEALSALAIVAQTAIPPVGLEGAQKAFLKAELERTRLDYERSRMLAEDNRIKCRNEILGAIRTFGVTCALYREEIEEKIIALLSKEEAE